MKNALIICNGLIEDYDRIIKKLKNESFNYVICCDGGLKHMSMLGIKPHYIIGDFDSLDPLLLKSYEESSIIEKHSVDKDDTDSQLGVKKAIELKCNNITLIGGTGKRLDHTMANIHLCIYCKSYDINLQVIDEYNIVQVVVDSIVVKNKKGFYCSLIPITLRVENVVARGLKYPLVRETIYIGETRTISNEITNNEMKIAIKKGILCLIISED